MQKEAAAVDLAKVRGDFPYLERQINDKPIVYFDNAATTQKPAVMIRSLTDYYEKNCANIHRGIHTMSQESSELYEEARRKVARFINADEREIVFVRNTTEAINLVSRSLRGEGRILTTLMEHHSNLLPWSRDRELVYAGIDRHGRIDMEDFRSKLDGTILLTAVTHISNVLGLVNPVEEIVEEAGKRGVLTLVDGAQSVPHLEIDVKELGCDFLVFSGHKMMAPSGIGVLYIREEIYDRMNTFLVGGSSIKEVHTSGFVPEDPPLCYEAGTPNVEGAIALGSAIDYIEALGLENIQAHDRLLMEAALERMGRIDDLEIYGGLDPEHRLSVVTFNVRGMGCHAVAKVLNLRENVMIRSGFHCAQPLHDRLGIGPSARASFYVYNTVEEVELMAGLLGTLAKYI